MGVFDKTKSQLKRFQIQFPSARLVRLDRGLGGPAGDRAGARGDGPPQLRAQHQTPLQSVRRLLAFKYCAVYHSSIAGTAAGPGRWSRTGR